MYKLALALASLCYAKHAHMHKHTRTHRLSGGELFDYLTQKDFLDEVEATNYMKQILDGLRYVHEQKIVHMDLKVRRREGKRDSRRKNGESGREGGREREREG